jgi:ketosteroid isomerase-like protein
MRFHVIANEAESSGSTRHVDTVKRVFDAFARRDVDGAIPFLHPHIRLWVVTSAVTRGGRPYVGHDGMRQYFEDAGRVWRELVLRPIEFDVVDKAIIVIGEVSARGPAGELKERAVWTWKFRDGLVIDCRVDSDATAAREALGQANTVDELVRGYITAFNRRDADSMVLLSDPDIVNHPIAISHGTRGGYVGHRGLRQWIGEMLANDPGHAILAREVQKVEPGRWAVLGDLVIDELPVSPFASLMGVSAGGTITEVREYLSEETLLRELGHLASPASR